MRSTYELLVDSDERGPSDDLRLRFEALSQFTPEEKRIAKAVIEGLILKHGAQRLARRESLMEHIVNLHIEHLPERKAQGHPIRPDPGFLTQPVPYIDFELWQRHPETSWRDEHTLFPVNSSSPRHPSSYQSQPHDAAN